MSTARLVPETRDLTGDDAWSVLRQTQRGQLFKDAFQRLRVADGFSHARSLAFMTALVLVQAIIGLVGLATLLGKSTVSVAIFATVQRAVPGPAGKALTTAVNHAHSTASQHLYSPVVLGLAGALITGAAAMGQLERGLNRIYGVEQDRPTLQKYGRACCFALSVGILLMVALACLAFGREVFAGTHSQSMNTAWAIARWPLGLALITISITVLFRWVPRRSQPKLSWLAFGSGVAVVLWTLATVGLGVFYRLSATFGQTYGPLAGTVALLFWCFLTSVALFFGAAVVAQLEAVRSGMRAPQDLEKVEVSEPAAAMATAGSAL